MIRCRFMLHLFHLKVYLIYADLTYAQTKLQRGLYMNIYMDESGSINRYCTCDSYFVVSMIHVLDSAALERAYKRFISSNYTRLIELDSDKVDELTGRIVKHGGRMFRNGKFRELKGAQFDRDMKHIFVDYFSRKHHFDVYYIVLKNDRLPARYFDSISRSFNYSVKSALLYFIENGYLPDEDCTLQLDERNERQDSRTFLENYLNTELSLSGQTAGSFSVTYFDSSKNRFIQIADVFSNLMYSHLQTGHYIEELDLMRELGILRGVFEIPQGI